MSHYPKGLRFDIYERFTLSEDAPGISELEDIELLPRITMQTRDDQAVLSGDLLLTGTYVGTEESSAVKELSHRIPVEITLPLKRIHRMDNIGIEIENFDVELLSARSLNITGVISLNGIAAPEEQSWNAQGEAVFEHEAAAQTNDSTVDKHEKDEPEVYTRAAAPSADGGEIHDSKRTLPTAPFRMPNVAPQEGQQEASRKVSNEAPLKRATQQQTSAQKTENDTPNAPLAQQQDVSSAHPHETRNEQVQTAAAVHQGAEQVAAKDAEVGNAEAVTENVPSKSSMHEEQLTNNGQSPGREEQPSAPSESAEQAAAPVESEQVAATEERTEAQVEAAQEAAAGERTEAPQDQVEVLQDQTEAEDSKELKIAFASKHSESGEWNGNADGVKSLLNKQAQEDARVTDETEEQASDSQEEEERSFADSVKWKNLLLSAEQDELRFSKMKMCIVQKEETLESIASRYSINPKEIVLYNRLDTDEVEEGQVIYIPS